MTKYRIRALTNGGGEKYVGQNLQLTDTSHAGKWTEKKAKKVAKARSQSSDIFECCIIDENTTLFAMYKDGECQVPANAPFDCAENKQGGGKTSRKKQVHPEPEEPEDSRFRLDLNKFTPAAPRKKELEPEGSRFDLVDLVGLNKFAPAAPSKEEFAASADQDRELLEQTMTTISDFLSLCDRAQSLLSTYSQKQAQEEALQEDLLHIIELTENVDAARGYQLYKDLRDCRKRRRVAKDMANLLGGVLRLGGEDSAQNMRRLVQSMSGREYHSRVDNRVIFF